MNRNHGEHGVTRGKSLLFPTVAIHHALDSISQALHIEINEQPDSNAAQSHVRQDLCLVNRMDCFHALDFDDNHVLNDQVDAVAKLNLFSIEHDRQSNLTRYRESAFSEFMSETRLIDTFQQPRSQHGVDVHRG